MTTGSIDIFLVAGCLAPFKSLSSLAANLMSAIIFAIASSLSLIKSISFLRLRRLCSAFFLSIMRSKSETNSPAPPPTPGAASVTPSSSDESGKTACWPSAGCWPSCCSWPSSGAFFSASSSSSSPPVTIRFRFFLEESSTSLPLLSSLPNASLTTRFLAFPISSPLSLPDRDLDLDLDRDRERDLDLEDLLPDADLDLQWES